MSSFNYIDRIVNSLEENKVSVLSGHSGVGKTRILGILADKLSLENKMVVYINASDDICTFDLNDDGILLFDISSEIEITNLCNSLDKSGKRVYVILEGLDFLEFCGDRNESRYVMVKNFLYNLRKFNNIHTIISKPWSFNSDYNVMDVRLIDVNYEVIKNNQVIYINDVKLSTVEELVNYPIIRDVINNRNVKIDSLMD